VKLVHAGFEGMLLSIVERCRNKNFSVQGVLSIIADQESWVMRDRMLNPRIFQQKCGDQTQKQKLWMPSTRTGATYRGGAIPT